MMSTKQHIIDSWSRNFNIKAKNKRLQNDSYFLLVFNFMYRMFLSPFNAVRVDDDDEPYALESTKLHKVICAFTHIGALAISVTFCLSQNSLLFAASCNISRLLECIGYFSGAAAVTVFLKTLWLDQNSILIFMNATKVCPVPKKLICFGALILCLMQVLASFFANSIQYTVDRLTSWMCLDGESLPLKLISFLLYGVVILGVTLYPMDRLVIMIMCVQLKALGKDFENFLQKERCVRTVVEKFEALRTDVGIGRTWTQLLLIFHYICILSFLANLPEVVRSGYINSQSLEHGVHGIEKWLAVFTWATQGVFLFIACDMPERVQNSCKDWIARRSLSEGLTNEEKFMLLTLTNRVEGKAIGLSSMFFTFTYSFVGTMLGLVTTYGVLVFQVNK